jgi:DNA-binding XRE family transcriptional regulator/tetratricopeptide (TPR) repeat protein
MSNSKSVDDNGFFGIGDKIRFLRNAMGWSQEHLAHRAKVKITTLRSIENINKIPRRDTLKKIASALNVDLENLASPHWSSSKFYGSINIIGAVSAISTVTATGGHVTKVLETNATMTMQTGNAVIPCNPSKNEAPTPTSLTWKQVVPELIEWARRQTAELNHLDVRIGGKQLYITGHGTLNLLQTLLHIGVASGQNERELRLALAHAATQLGWFAEDAGMLDQAAGHYHFGIEMARMADGKDFIIYGLTRLAAVALARGNPEQCLSRLTLAECEAGEDSPWQSFIQLFAIEAYGQLGDGKAAGATLAKADKLFDNRKQDCVPEWAFAIPRPSESAIAARSFLSTDTKFSATLYEEALKRVSTKFACDRLHLLAGLGIAKQALGETDEALSHASEVLQSISSLDVSIPRVEKLLTKFEKQLPDDPITRDFREQLDQYRHIQQN